MNGGGKERWREEGGGRKENGCMDAGWMMDG